MAQDFLGNYTTSPNAEVMQLMAQQNQSDADRAARFAGGSGSYANIEEGPDLQSILRRLAGARTLQERQEALQSINEQLQSNHELRSRIILGAHEASQREASSSRLMAQEAQIASQGMAQRYALEGQQAERQAVIQREAMEHAAKQMMVVQQQQNIYEMQLAQADEAAKAPIYKLAQEEAQRRSDLQSRQIAANAAFAIPDDNLRRQFLARQAELHTAANALVTYRKHIKTAMEAGLANMEKEWQTNPNLGGMPVQSALGQAGRGVAKGVDWIGELFTGDVWSDIDLTRYLSAGEAGAVSQPFNVGEFSGYNPNNMGAFYEQTRGLQALAAAGQMTGFADAALSGAHGAGNTQIQTLVANARQGQKAANKYIADYLTHQVVGGLTSGGIAIDTGTARPAIQKLITTLVDLKSTNASAEEVRTRVQAALKEAAPQIYGPNMGENAVPHLVDGLDQVLEDLNLNSGETAKLVWDAKHTVNPEAIQNAASYVARERAGSLRHLIRLGARGVVFDSKNIEEALGMVDKVYDPKANLFQPGLLPTADTEQGRMLELVLGSQTAGTLKDWRTADVARRQAEAELSTAARLGESKGQMDLQKLLQEMATSMGKKKMSLAQEELRRLMAETPGKGLPPVVP